MSKGIGTRLAVTVLLCAFAAMPASAQFPYNQLQAMFDQAAKSGSDLSKPHLWGFYFANPTRAPLDTAAALLSMEGFQLVSLQLTQPDTWQLHVERVEAHSADSLHALNLALEDFARNHGIEKLHSMDIGPASSQ
jgi:prophage maintenance system killer protein